MKAKLVVSLTLRIGWGKDIKVAPKRMRQICQLMEVAFSSFSLTLTTLWQRWKRGGGGIRGYKRWRWDHSVAVVGIGCGSYAKRGSYSSALPPPSTTMPCIKVISAAHCLVVWMVSCRSVWLPFLENCHTAHSSDLKMIKLSFRFKGFSDEVDFILNCS